LTGAVLLFFTFRVITAQVTMDSGFGLRSIGAVVIGGTFLTGGQGSVPGILTVVLLLEIISTGVNLLHVDPA